MIPDSAAVLVLESDLLARGARCEPPLNWNVLRGKYRREGPKRELAIAGIQELKDVRIGSKRPAPEEASTTDAPKEDSELHKMDISFLLNK